MLLAAGLVAFGPGLIKPASYKLFDDSNPFSSASSLPYQAPPFDKIKDADFEPALLEGMRIQRQEIDKIAQSAAPPSFENTLVAMEKTGELLTRVNNVFNLLTGANTNPVLQKLQEDMAPKLSAHQDATYLDAKLFKRVETVYNNRTNAKLDPESRRLLEWVYQQFILAGAKLSEADKASLKKRNEEEAFLSAKFTNQLLAAAKEGALVISDSARLAGLTQAEKEALAQNANAKNLPGKWLIPLQNTTQQPLLHALSNRQTRQALFEASWNRAERSDSNDTRKTILRIAQIRLEKAKLMGYPNYAAWKLQDQMAKTDQAVENFLVQLVPSATAKARSEAADIQALIDKQGGGFKLQPWDWDYYAEQVRKEKYDLDDNEIKPYFELNKVLENGVFYAATLLYGLHFKERHDLPVYQADVRVFEVADKDNKPFALFYCDYFKRDNKSGGAWMSNMVGQSTLLRTKPVIYNVCNFTKPAPGQPSLISFDDVTTMFHEFGHALHGLFASQKYPTLSGTNTARDFVEFPSQFNEHWALDPKVLQHYAVHYKTGKPMPQALIEKIKKAGTFNKGYSLTELLAASALDMQWHSATDGAALQDADQFEKEALQKTGFNLPEVPTRYRSSYFLHIWSNGYAAGYYAYQWTKMLEEDAYAWFTERGGLTRANGQRFRDMILSRGNTEDLARLFRAFRGHDPDIRAMQEALGLPVR
ncbi:MAG: peptidyl-dipeptidase Dcp [Williamsia sp.]|nr:peptidyl-dipeptidase Dcp [Williamsia sp.]